MLILTLVVLPTVIIAAREAIRAVPDSIRQGAYALGATKWQVVWRQVLPAAIPGIATGSILALSRALGETAPLLLVGALTYVSFNPTILGDFTALPVQIYQWVARPQIVPDSRRLGDHRSARNRSDAERLRHLDSQSLREKVVTPLSVTMADVSVDLAERAQQLPPMDQREVLFEVKDLAVSYNGSTALEAVSLEIYRNFVTAFIGPSGCGKSTFIRCFNHLNDLIPGAVVDGTILYRGEDLYGPHVDSVEVRKRIGMVFQKPNPFPKSIYDNVAFGPRVLGMTDKLDERVERALEQAALWDEVKDRLKAGALSLSGGQQQRLCIARCLAVEPDVILMDEPASALDPIATTRIEDLMHELKRDYTIVVVTHNMQQAARIADMTAFFSVTRAEEGKRVGILVEYDATSKIFTQPSDKRTEDYVTGRFG